MNTIELGVEVMNGLKSGTSCDADFRSVRRHEQMVCISDLINARMLASSVGQFPQIPSEMYEKIKCSHLGEGAASRIIPKSARSEGGPIDSSLVLHETPT